MLLDFVNNRINLVEDGLVRSHSPLVSTTEDVLVVVCKLFTADCTDHVVRARLWLL